MFFITGEKAPLKEEEKISEKQTEQGKGGIYGNLPPIQFTRINWSKINLHFAYIVNKTNQISTLKLWKNMVPV